MSRGWFLVFVHRSDEAVASLGDGLDVFASVRAIPEHLPQVKDVPRQIAFLDENARPDCFQQFFLLDDVACPSTITRRVSRSFGGSMTGWPSRSKTRSTASRL